MEEIIWKKHPLYKDYEANQNGEIRCVCFGNKAGNIRILKQKTDSYTKGKRVGIKGKTIPSHRIVYECFYGIIPENLEIDHIDGNHSNNKIENLRACTHKENCKNPITIQRYREAKRKEIIAFDRKTGKIVGVHSSKEWSEILNVTKEDIMAAARMKYIFQYK